MHLMKMSFDRRDGIRDTCEEERCDGSEHHLEETIEGGWDVGGMVAACVVFYTDHGHIFEVADEPSDSVAEHEGVADDVPES